MFWHKGFSLEGSYFPATLPVVQAPSMIEFNFVKNACEISGKNLATTIANAPKQITPNTTINKLLELSCMNLTSFYF